MAQTRSAASEADRAAMAELLDMPPSQDMPEPADASVFEDKSVEDVLAPAAPDEDMTASQLDDVLADTPEAEDAHDLDGIYDTLFAEEPPEASKPSVTGADPASSRTPRRTRRLARVWQGGQDDQGGAETDPVSGSSPTERLLGGALANENAAPPPPLTLDSLLGQDDDPGDDAAESDEAEDAELALAMIFAEDGDEDAPDPAVDPSPVDPAPEALQTLLLSDPVGEDVLDQDLLEAVLDTPEFAQPETAAVPAVPSDPLADLIEAEDEGEDDQEDDWMAVLLGDAYDMDAPAETPPAAPEPVIGQADPQGQPDDGPDHGPDHSPDQSMDRSMDPASELVAEDPRDTEDDDLLADILGSAEDDPVSRATPDGDAPDDAPLPTPIPFQAPPPVVDPEPAPAPASKPGRKSRGRGGMDDLDKVLKKQAARTAPKRKWLIRFIWLLLLGGLLYIAFLPYRFEVGGEFTIRPVDRAEARARTSGEITTVAVREGDWVEAGDVLAVLANWTQSHNLALARSEGEQLQAQLATLTDGARAEEIMVAEQALASAEVQLERATQDLERQETLFASGTITQKAVEDARSARELAVSSRDQAAAALALVQAGPRETDIEALRATIKGNEEQQAFAELMLEYTNIRAPVAGQVVSSLNEVPVGYSMTSGGLFAEIEDNRVVIAELAVPEITIEEVELNAPVELRLWSNPDEAITGIVRTIAPRAEEQEFGWAVRVQVEVPNPDGRLAANMTGFGKIEAEERPVWQAFSRAIERFFVIELWSWMP